MMESRQNSTMNGLKLIGESSLRRIFGELPITKGLIRESYIFHGNVERRSISKIIFAMILGLKLINFSMLSPDQLLGLQKKSHPQKMSEFWFTDCRKMAKVLSLDLLKARILSSAQVSKYQAKSRFGQKDFGQ